MTLTAPAFASPVDAFRWGEHRKPIDRTVRLRGTPLPEAGRYHLYGAHFCPASHRLAILRSEAGFEDAVSLSWVHGQRDARGWAFREATGHDPVNGFTLLREAYDATDPGYAGPVSVPVLWDTVGGRIVSNDATPLGVDLLRLFGGSRLYPAALASKIDEAAGWVAQHFSAVVGCAVYRRADADRLDGALRRLDTQLAHDRYLVGDVLTDADVRLWVGLVRYDAGPNAHGAIGPHLDAYPHLWAYARRLYARPAFRETTEFGAFTAPLAAVPDWG